MTRYKQSTKQARITDHESVLSCALDTINHNIRLIKNRRKQLPKNEILIKNIISFWRLGQDSRFFLI
jgi:hypothetical protein